MVLPKNNIQWDEECDERGIGGKPHVNVNLDDNLNEHEWHESAGIWKRGVIDVRRWLYLESLYLQKHHCGKHLDIRMFSN